MARPKKAPEEKQGPPIGTRFSLVELQTIDKRAAVLGLSRSEYIRQKTLAGKARPSSYRQGIDPQAVTVLNNLGVEVNQLLAMNANLGNVVNQVARKVNSGVRVPGDSQYVELPAIIQENQERIRANQASILEMLERVLKDD